MYAAPQEKKERRVLKNDSSLEKIRSITKSIKSGQAGALKKLRRKHFSVLIKKMDPEDAKYVKKTDAYRAMTNDELRDVCFDEMAEEDFIEDPQIDSERARDLKMERYDLTKFIKNLHDHRYQVYYPKRPNKRRVHDYASEFIRARDRRPHML